jgi:hypothetical protein
MGESTWKGLLTGIAGGLVAWWAVDRFYTLSRASSKRHAIVPYCIGAGIGSAYAAFILRNNTPSIARVPLGAAIYLASPEETAAPAGGRTAGEKAGNFALRLVSRGLKKAAEMALVA